MSEQAGYQPSRVLFDSATSSARSQIAEAWLRFLGGGFYEVSSAGSQASESLSADVVSAMAEVGVDTSTLRPEPFVSFLGQRFDYVVTIGDRPDRTHPSVEAVKARLHWQIEDPDLAEQSGAFRLESMRRVREEVRGKVADFVLADPPALYRLLGEQVVWGVLERLVRSDSTLADLSAAIGRGEGAAIERLRRLQGLGLVSTRQSDFDRSVLLYHVELTRLRSAFSKAAERLHPALVTVDAGPGGSGKEPGKGTRPPIRILFLCTHNSARSQMAEGIARHLGRGLIEAYSAGTAPSTVHPDAVRACTEIGVDITRQESKHLEVFLEQRFDYIVTVCDRARESCPVFPGDPERIHWSLPDPSLIEDPRARYRAFRETAGALVERIRLLLSLLEREWGGLRSREA